jgi:hypothetical protein
MSCTENFYRRHIEREMNVTDSADPFREKFRSGLSSIEVTEPELDPCSDGSICPELSLERLEALSKRLSMSESVDTHYLDANEEAYFLRAVASGALSATIDIWSPWWEDLDGTTINAAEYRRTLDITVRDLPDFSTLSKRPASPLMIFLVTDLLFSYCRLMREYNGCWRDDPLDAASRLVAASSALGADARPGSMHEVVLGFEAQSALRNCHASPTFQASQNVSATTSAHLSLGSASTPPPSPLPRSNAADVLCLLRDRRKASAALADAWAILDAAQCLAQSPTQTPAQRPVQMPVHRPAQGPSTRKAWYFLVWASGVGAHVLQAAHGELQAALAAVARAAEGHEGRSGRPGGTFAAGIPDPSSEPPSNANLLRRPSIVEVGKRAVT